jgi:hypothetical protein
MHTALAGRMEKNRNDARKADMQAVRGIRREGEAGSELPKAA